MSRPAEQSWLDALAAGASRSEVALGIVLSAERLRQTAPALDAGVFVPDPSRLGQGRA